MASADADAGDNELARAPSDAGRVTAEPSDAAAAQPFDATLTEQDASAGETPRDAESARNDAATGADAGAAMSPGPPAPPGSSACYDRFAKRLLCEGFEAPLAQPPWWTIPIGAAVATVSQPSYVGEGALQAQTSVAGGQAFTGRSALPAVTSGSLFLRAYVFVPREVSLEHAVVLGVAESPLPYGSVSVVLRNEGARIHVHPRGPGTEDVYVDGSAAIARDRWLCLQLYVAVSDASGAVRLSIDGQTHAESRVPLRTLPAAGYQDVNIGLIYAKEEQPATRILFDELVVDTAPIPCD